LLKTRKIVRINRFIIFIPLLGIPLLVIAADVPTENPVERYDISWTNEIKWNNTIDISAVEGKDWHDKLDRLQNALADSGGGVIYFPAGRYVFRKPILLRNGIILRGESPIQSKEAKSENYILETVFEFPKYIPIFEEKGTPKDTGFKGIHLAYPDKASNCGLVNLYINRGHIYFAQGDKAKNRLVYGCILQNAALMDEKVPDISIGQKPWQRFTKWHQAAIHIYVRSNALVANNRLPKSTDSFLQKGYVLKGRGKDKGKPVVIDEGVWFDYDNRPGICVNAYCIGGAGGRDPKGTPQTHPEGFATGLIIRDNYVYSTGRTAIEFTGDGTICSFNIIRFKPNVVRWTNTGIQMASGSSTNDNRAITMRGWRYTVEGNDYLSYRNLAGKGPYYINDGEGLMHEGHCNSTIRDSQIINNKGNAYLSIYQTAGIDGLLIQGNDIRPEGPGVDTKISSIFVVTNRSNDTHPCKNVKIVGNITAGSGIKMAGSPGVNNVVKDNRNIGKLGTIYNWANAATENNSNYEIRIK